MLQPTPRLVNHLNDTVMQLVREREIAEAWEFSVLRTRVRIAVLIGKKD